MKTRLITTMRSGTLLVLAATVLGCSESEDRLQGPSVPQTDVRAPAPSNQSSLTTQQTLPTTSEPLPVAAPPADGAGRARCRLRVRGLTRIDGPCRVRLDHDGSFQIAALEGGYFAQVLLTGDEAFGYWNETPDATHAHAALGALKREDACWKNRDAEICAWRADG